MTTTRPADTRPWNDRPLFTHPARLTAADFYAWGGDGGTATEGDVLVNQTADGVDLNTIWNEVASALSLLNKQRSALASLISYPTVSVGDAVPQQVASEHFEVASEFGEAQGIKSEPNALVLGNDFEDHDISTRFTWKALRAMTAEQAKSAVNSVFEADNRNVTGTLLRRMFDNTLSYNEFQHPVYPLWDGVHGSPPPFAGQEFPAQTSHLLASGSNTIDPSDLLTAIRAVTSKGYGISPTSRLLVLAHPDEVDVISTFRAGIETNGFESKHDYIPSQSAPAFLLPEAIVGEQAPGSFAGVEIAGSWGPAWVSPHYWIPKGYFAVVATGGPNSSMNPVAFRQHVNPAYQGLRMIPGRDQRYPLQESHFARGFGTGVRHRGAACVMQITSALTYTPPTWAWH